jgi:hypothetical protein
VLEQARLLRRAVAAAAAAAARLVCCHKPLVRLVGALAGD